MRMNVVFGYCTSLSILQMLYVTEGLVSCNSPTTVYLSISSQSVPTNNRNPQQKLMSSIIQPLRTSGGTLTSLNSHQIDNLDKEISFNKDLGLNTIQFHTREVSQKGGVNDGTVSSENTITNTQPSKISFGSSLSSRKFLNFAIPVHVKKPGLSNVYYGTSKMSDRSQINDVSKFKGSINTDGSIQSGGFVGLSEAGGLDGEKERNIRFSESDRSITFSRQNSGGVGGSIGVDENIKISEGRRSHGIPRARGVSGVKSGDRKIILGEHVEAIRFGDKGVGIRLSRSVSGNTNRNSRNYESRSFEGFSGPGHISGASGPGAEVENIKIGKRHRSHGIPRARSVSEVNRGDRKITLGEPVEEIRFRKPSVGKRLSRSVNVNINRSGGNYGGGSFGGQKFVGNIKYNELDRNVGSTKEGYDTTFGGI